MQLLNVFKITLLLFLASCVNIPKPPQVSHCLSDHGRQKMDCENTKGTSYNIPFSSPSVDKMICMPGPDYLDMISWQKKVFIEMMKAIDFEKAKR